MTRKIESPTARFVTHVWHLGSYLRFLHGMLDRGPETAANKGKWSFTRESETFIPTVMFPHECSNAFERCKYPNTGSGII